MNTANDTFLKALIAGALAMIFTAALASSIDTSVGTQPLERPLIQAATVVTVAVDRAA